MGGRIMTGAQQPPSLLGTRRGAHLQLRPTGTTEGRFTFGQRTDAVTEVLVAAAVDGLDVGDLLAAACRQAAARLDGARDEHGFEYDGVAALLRGRPGSWEAENIGGLAGGWEDER